MSGPDDWVRRGDVEAAIREITVSRPLHDRPASADRPAWAVRNEIAAAIRDLPADRVAEAAGKLAEAFDSWLGRDCEWPTVLLMLNRYRSAVAARSAGTTPNDRLVTHKLAVAERSAGLSDGGKDRKATGELSDAPKPAPARARCGGSGQIDDPVTINPACGGYVESSSPCPECGVKP